MLSNDDLERQLECCPKDPIASSSFHSFIVDPPSEFSQLDAIHQALDLTFEPTPFQHGAQLQPLTDAQNVFVLTDGRQKRHPLTMQPQDHHGQQSLGNAAMSVHDMMQGVPPPPLPDAPILAQGAQGSNQSHLPQEDRWDELYQKLLRYKAEHGHCVIPQNYPEDLALARWVRRQRYQYKRKVHNKTSSMSDRRQRLLEDVGFVWEPQADSWEVRLQELQEYKRRHGDCNVPSRFPRNQKLASWVKRQRRQYQEAQIGLMSSGLPRDRVARLNNMGFVWSIRGNNNGSERPSGSR